MKMMKKTAGRLLTLILAAAMLFAMSVPALAVSQGELDKLQEERDRLEARAEEQQAVVDALTEERALFVERKLALDAKIELNQQEIALINSQIEIYDSMIEEQEAALEEAQETEKRQSELLRSRIRAMEEHGNMSYIAFLFEATSLTDLLSRISDMGDIMNYDKVLEAQYAEAREAAAAIKAGYEETRAHQEELKKELDSKQAQLNAQIEAAYTLIANIDDLSDDAKAEYEAIAKAREEAEKEFDALIAKRAAEQAAQQAQQRPSSGGNSGGSGTTGGGTSGGGNTGGTSAVSLTSLTWPVPSCSLITSRFGYRISPTAGASSYHGGLDIGAQQGASIVASEAGEVILAGYNGGYGNCVMIDHGNNIVTLYGHMDSIGVSNGQYVSKGQYIGAVGSTGVSTGPHCHFEIRLSGSQTDPAPYFYGLSYYDC